MRLFDETEDAVNGRPGAADFVAAWARRGPKDVEALASRPLDFIVWSDEGVLWEGIGSPPAFRVVMGYPLMHSRDEAQNISRSSRVALGREVEGNSPGWFTA